MTNKTVKTKNNFFSLRTLVTMGPVGYLPGSGTVATVLFIPIVALCKWAVPSFYAYSILTALSCIGAIMAVHYAYPSSNDRSEIVIDECVGLMASACWLPFTWQAFFINLILFRFFDIVKPGYIGLSESLPGAWGIVIDDVAAGITSIMCTHGILFLYRYLVVDVL